MNEDQNQKKVIKKKIKLKVSTPIDNISAVEKTEETKKSEEVKVKKAAVETKSKPAKAEEPKVEAPGDHLKRMNEKFAKMMKPEESAALDNKPRKFEYQRHNKDARPVSGQSPRPGFQRDGVRRGPPSKDRAAGGSFQNRFAFKPVQPEQSSQEKDHLGKGKHRTTFVSRAKSGADIKEKLKYREEEILLSKMEDSIRKKTKKGEAVIPAEIEIGEVIKISDLAKKMNLKASGIIQKLVDLGVQATINDTIDADTASIVASEFNCKVNIKSLKEEVEIKEATDDLKSLSSRFPVVTIMGHVDHGKTKLLDAIRNSSIAEHESGGITQHIGAYRVKTPKGDITFIDTPGHEAFTAMRARGANVTDIVILVVSAVDGVMPQTLEALNHAKAAKVPIIVAVNKTDLPDSNPERVKQQLSEHSILSEDWGGENMFVNISALKKTGIQELLDAIILQAEVLELKANPDKMGIGYVIESKMDIGRGAVATVIVKNGCIKIGDNFLAGITMGKVRGMFDENGNKIKVAMPSYPVEIMGFNEVPNAGDKFYIVENEEIAKQITSKRQDLKKIEEIKNIKKIQMQNAMEAMSTGTLKELKVIIKGDVQGSVEAIKNALSGLVYEEVKVTVIHAGVGAVVESDLIFASSTANTAEIGVIILAFRVRVDTIAKEKAESEGIIIKRFNIIYELIDYVNGIMKGMLTPEIKEQVIGNAEITDIFKIKDVGKIAGGIVKEGYIRKSEKVRIYRDGVQVWEGKINTLKRFKDDVSEVQEGFECGLSFINYENFKKGDIVECFTSEVIKPL